MAYMADDKNHVGSASLAIDGSTNIIHTERAPGSARALGVAGPYGQRDSRVLVHKRLLRARAPLEHA